MSVRVMVMSVFLLFLSGCLHESGLREPEERGGRGSSVVSPKQNTLKGAAAALSEASFSSPAQHARKWLEHGLCAG
jgi:hypothetical protein